MKDSKTVIILLAACLIIFSGIAFATRNNESEYDKRIRELQEEYEKSGISTSLSEQTSIPKSNKEKQSLEINKDWKWVVEGDYVYTRGRVKNVGSRTISYFEVYCEYCDENGNVLDTDYTNSGLALYPNNEKEFEIMHKDNPEYKKVRVFVDNIVCE